MEGTSTIFFELALWTALVPASLYAGRAAAWCLWYGAIEPTLNTLPRKAQLRIARAVCPVRGAK